jgi:hypothetical protein
MPRHAQRRYGGRDMTRSPKGRRIAVFFRCLSLLLLGACGTTAQRSIPKTHLDWARSNDDLRGGTDKPDAEHINLPNGVTLYLYRTLNNGSFLNYGLRYVRFADYLTPDKKSTVRRKLVDIMLQPLQSPPQ